MVIMRNEGVMRGKRLKKGGLKIEPKIILTSKTDYGLSK